MRSETVAASLPGSACARAIAMAVPMLAILNMRRIIAVVDGNRATLPRLQYQCVPHCDARGITALDGSRAMVAKRGHYYEGWSHTFRNRSLPHVAAVSKRRISRGDLPIHRRQAWLKELTSSKPRSQAILEIGMSSSSK